MAKRQDSISLYLCSYFKLLVFLFLDLAGFCSCSLLCLVCVLATLSYSTNSDGSLLLIFRTLAFHLKKKAPYGFKEHSLLIQLFFVLKKKKYFCSLVLYSNVHFQSNYKYFRIKCFLQNLCHISVSVRKCFQSFLGL